MELRELAALCLRILERLTDSEKTRRDLDESFRRLRDLERAREEAEARERELAGRLEQLERNLGNANR